MALPSLVDQTHAKCDDINKFLFGRLLYRMHTEDIQFFNSMFVKKKGQVHDYDAHHKDNYHLPCCKQDLCYPI